MKVKTGPIPGLWKKSELPTKRQARLLTKLATGAYIRAETSEKNRYHAWLCQKGSESELSEVTYVTLVLRGFITPRQAESVEQLWHELTAHGHEALQQYHRRRNIKARLKTVLLTEVAKIGTQPS